MQFCFMISFNHRDFSIDYFNDPSFRQNGDSPTQYNKIYEPEDDKEYKPSSQHGIRIYNGEEEISSAILLAGAGATVVADHSALIHNNHLIARCSNMVVSLTIPKLDLRWMLAADMVSCFTIHEYQDTYITHGELSVTRIDQLGNVIWEFGGGDIFLRLDQTDSFRMNPKSILLTDFGGTTYEIDYNGKLIKTTDPTGPKKKWWHF